MLTAVSNSTSVYLPPYISISFIVITLLITYGILKRGNRIGCISFAYVGAVVGSILMFSCFACYMLFAKTKETIFAYNNGEHHIAKVVDVTTYEKYDKDRKVYTTMYTPIISFTTNNGMTITRSLEFSSSNISVGDTYNIIYTPQNDHIITLGFTLVITFAATIIFTIVFGTAIVGAILYAIGKNMDNFWRFIQWFGFTIFLPSLMVGFELLLIYGLFYGNPVPKWVSAILLFFIVILALGIWGYIKMIFTKGTPTTKRVSPGKWSSDWPSNNKKKRQSPTTDSKKNWLGDDKKIY